MKDVPARAPRETRLLVLSKIRAILDCFTIEEPTLTLATIRARCGLPPSTCQRLVQNLVREGFLERERGGYRIGFAVARWAAAVTRGIDLVEASRPFLTTLRDQTLETAILFLRSGHRRTVAASVTPTRAISRVLEVGLTMPLHLGSAGKVFLAFDDLAMKDVLAQDPTLTISPAELDEIRHQGWCATFEERENEVSSVSAPVFDYKGEICAVIGIVAPVSRLNPETLGNEYVHPVSSSARMLSAYLGWPGSDS